MPPLIHVAFRFHGNFYHSYRGDTPDELGFGKDIRIIRHLIDTLDELNARGIPVRGTWDFENYFSLETIMPAHCPDLIAGLQRRARAGRDEMQLMSYNNGLVSAHTPREFEAAICRGITNSAGSGQRDLFGDSFEPMVRPQEMILTPIHLDLYRAYGIQSISLFYSSLPFNGFSNFVPPLSFLQRYNPLTLSYPGIAGTMTLLPCYNTGDLSDHLTLRRWVKQMRRQQLALEHPQDVLLLIDMDADDEFWVGFDVPLLNGRFSTIGGLKGLVEDIAGLEYVCFTTPGRYLKDHPPVGELSIGQDTADGSFDGLSSWAEKWSNQRLWTGLERARLLDLHARRLSGEHLPAEAAALLECAFEARLKLLSTTHFGMSAPVMNLTREGSARELVCQAVESAAAAFACVAETPRPAAFSLLDYPRGDSTSQITYPARPSRALVSLRLKQPAPASLLLMDGSGKPLPSAVLKSAAGSDLLFVESFQPLERKDYRLAATPSPAEISTTLQVSEHSLGNEHLSLTFDPRGEVASLRCGGEDFAAGRFLRSGIVYGGRRLSVDRWETVETLSAGLLAVLRQQASLSLPGGFTARYEREFLLAAGLPHLYLSMRIFYPRTPDRGYQAKKAQRLQQAWDEAWQELTPCELFPALNGTPENPLRVWKHNYCDHVSTYRLDYGRYSRNTTLDSVNNHVTHAWLAVSDGRRGLLVAQNAEVTSGMAFCPLRTRKQGGALRLRLNPFGTYTGHQYHYASGDTGLGNLMATTFSAADHIRAYAPSYNGRMHEFSLLVAPYAGDAPPGSLRNDAEAFAYPYLLCEDDHFLAAPAHRGWDPSGLGELLP